MSGFDDSGRKRAIVYMRDALNSFRTSVHVPGTAPPLVKLHLKRYLVLFFYIILTDYAHGTFFP